MGVRRNKLSKTEREELKRYRRDVRCDGSWAKDGSCVIDLSPFWLPSGCVCLTVCVCVLVSLELYSRPPCAWNITGCRSKSLEHGLPLNEFPMHPGVTHEYTPWCLHLLISMCAGTHTRTHPLRCPCQPSCLINNAFLYWGCAATLSTRNTQAKQHTEVLKTININIKQHRHKPCGGNHHLPI